MNEWEEAFLAFLLHGDEKHRQWLREEFEKFLRENGLVIKKEYSNH